MNSGRQRLGRVEKILVAAIFGVVALILGITAFVPEGGSVPRDGTGTAAGAGPGPGAHAGEGAGVPGGERLAGGRADRRARTPLEALLEEEGGLEAGGREAGGPEQEAEGRGALVGEVAAEPDAVGPTSSGPGAGRRGRPFPGDPRFVEVEVLRGETFSQIVARECGTLRYLDHARMLNEDLDLERIQPGQRLVLPYVPADQLPPPGERDAPASREILAAPLSRTVGSPAVGSPAPDSARPRAETGEAAASYRVQRGDTLWKIAERRWGRAHAPAKIQEILRLNRDRVSNPDAIREGMVLRMP